MVKNGEGLMLLVVAAIAGVLGGVVSGRLLLPDRVLAQAPRVIEAQTFRLVDGRGTTRAYLGLGKGGTRLSLRNATGSSSMILTVYDEDKRDKDKRTPQITLWSGRRVIAKLPAKFRRSRSVTAVDKIRLPRRSTGRERGGIMGEKSVSPAALDVIEEKMNELVESVNDLRAFH